jgi:hypothetical protein
VWRYTCADGAGHQLAQPAPVAQSRGQGPFVISNLLEERRVYPRSRSYFRTTYESHSSSTVFQALPKPDEPCRTCDQVALR